MGTLGDLGKSMKQKAANVALNGDQLVRVCALAIDTSVVLATPVDTGRARGNWQVEIGMPAEGTVDNLDKSGGGTIAAAKQTIDSYKGGSSVNITNNLPYIGRLNQGYSHQAPAGFVERSIQIGVAAVRSRAGSMTEKPA